MQISTIATTNPNLHLGLWVEYVNLPQAGAGQIQQFIPTRNVYFIEHWQKPVLDGLSINGLLYKPCYLRLGHYQNTLYYVHHTEVRQMEFAPTESMSNATDFDEVQTHFSTRKEYLQEHHLKYGKLISPEDEAFIFDYWQNTQGDFSELIPYLVQGLESKIGHLKHLLAKIA